MPRAKLKAKTAGQRTALGQPVELDKVLDARLVEQLERVHAEARHVAVVQRDADVVEQERKHVHALWVVAEEVPDAPELLHCSVYCSGQRDMHPCLIAACCATACSM